MYRACLHIIIGILLFLSPVFCKAQSISPDEAQQKSLIDLSKNSIQGNTLRLRALFEKMEDLLTHDNEKISILHLGDSHIQAGYLTNVVRERLQGDFGNAGRGLILPLNLMRTNEPEGYRIYSHNSWNASRCAIWTPPFDVGIGGVAISSHDSVVRFAITAKGNPFTSITVFHHEKTPLLLEDSIYRTGFYCDFNNTDHSTQIVLNQAVDSVVLYSDTRNPAYKTQTYYGFSLENGQAGVIYHSAGVNGNCYEYVNRSPAIIAQSKLLNPDLIIISFGTNEANLRRFNSGQINAQIDKLIESLQEVNPNAVLLLTTPMDFSTRTRSGGVIRYVSNKNVRIMRQCIIRAARDYDLPYWDMYEVVTGEGAMDRWYKAGLAKPDRLHLQQDGYELQGKLLHRAIVGAFYEFIEGRSFYIQ